MQNDVISQRPAAAVPSIGIRTACTVAFMMGAGLVFIGGFAHSDVLHNAAHDTRHSLAFPCH